ncbi:hypothetical protein ACKP2L_05150 [Oenococcus alcoholitolerans]|uniref:Uncharacterized protein n=1 Tax=Oenococcus alcoholitolerans TaxID=931074 RepID=A0ABR4XPE7_9LACO|nr:hypothetical protein Q757_08005 [Oenococcus alcoholitolerans]
MTFIKKLRLKLALSSTKRELCRIHIKQQWPTDNPFALKEQERLFADKVKDLQELLK